MNDLSQSEFDAQFADKAFNISFLNMTRIPLKYRDIALIDKPRKWEMQIYNDARLFCNQYSKLKRNDPAFHSAFIIEGDKRVGKTHLACAMLRYLITGNKRRVLGYFINACSLGLQFERAKRDFNIQYVDLIKDLVQPEILCLDDLHTFPFDEWADKLYDLVNERIERNKGFIITTDVPMKKYLDGFMDLKTRNMIDRIIRRLREMTGMEKSGAGISYVMEGEK